MTEGRRRGDLVYFPVPLLLLALLATFLVVVPFVVLTVGDLLGLTALETTLAFAAIVLGSTVNIPLRVVESRVRVAAPPDLPLMGWMARPVVRTQRTILAVNVGGALVPTFLAATFLLGLPAASQVATVLATGAVTAVAYLVAEPVPGTGIAVPALIPPLASVGAAGLAFGLLGAPVAGIGRAAFVAGVLGTLAGADLLHLPRVTEVGAPVVSIGGAGTFDGIVLSGVFGTLFAALLLGPA